MIEVIAPALVGLEREGHAMAKAKGKAKGKKAAGNPPPPGKTPNLGIKMPSGNAPPGRAKKTGS